MAFSKGSRRSESGAQLLARLSTRPDIKDVDSFIFDRTSSSCRIIELYGMEGTGKSELALQCSARICLPSSWNGVLLSGLEAKVIYIDTDSKFSILRLAVILEKQILEMLKSKSAYNSKVSENAAIQDSLKVNFESTHQTQVNSRDSKEEDLLSTISRETEKKAPLQKEERDTCKPQVLKEQCNVSICCDISDNSITTQHSSSSIQTERVTHNVLGKCEKKSIAVDENVSSISNSDALNVFSPGEVEQIVQDSLSRIQVLRPSNSQQLLSSLLSLETILMEDTLYTLVIIDSISSFYWLDRLASPNSYEHLDSRMAPISKTLKRYASDFGVTCLITKSAYFMGKKHPPNQDHTATLFGLSSKTEKIFEPYTYHEYLGKIWSSINVKRIMLTNIIDILNKGDKRVEGKMTEEGKKIRAYCMFSETVKQYIFKDDLLVPDTSVQGS